MIEKLYPDMDDPDDSDDSVSDISAEQIEEMQRMLDRLSGIVDDRSSNILSSLSKGSKGDISLDDQLQALLERDFAEDDMHSELLAQPETEERAKRVEPKSPNIFTKLFAEPILKAVSLISRRKKDSAEGDNPDDTGVPLSETISDSEEPANDEAAEAKPVSKKMLAPVRALNILPKRAFIITIGILALFAVGIGILDLVVFSRLRGAERESKKIPGAISVEHSSNESNNSNFVYIDSTKQFLDSRAKLSKVGLDKTASTFYLDNYFDPEKYTFTLIGSDGKEYAPDMAFQKIFSERDSKSVVRFEPIDESEDVLTLTVTENATLESVSFTIQFQNPVSLSGARVLSGPVELSDDGSYFCRLDYGIFSSSGSEIHISAGTGNRNESLVFGDNGGIALYESVRPVLKSFERPMTYSYSGGMISVRMDFAALRTLGGKLDLQINGLNLSRQIGEVIPATDIYHGIAEPSSKTYSFGSRGVVIQGMMLQGSKMVLVAYAIDKTLPLNNDDKYANRIQIYLDADLTVQFADGDIRTFHGDSKSIVKGCDTVFDLSEYKDELGRIQVSSYSVTLNAVNFPLPKVSYTIDLSKTSDKFNSEYQLLSDSLKDAFTSRLRYKCALIGEDEIIGFDSGVLQNVELKKMYTPAESESAMSVQILTMSVEGDTAYAVVCEYLAGTAGNAAWYKNHKIKAVRSEDKWIITEDEIMY